MSKTQKDPLLALLDRLDRESNTVDAIAHRIASLLAGASSEREAAMALEKAREMALVSWRFRQAAVEGTE